MVIPKNIAAKDVSQTETGLSVTWANDGHKSFYRWEWLQARDRPSFQSKFPLKHWDSRIQENPPTISYEEVMNSDDGVRKWTNLISSYGFSYVDGCPVSPSATQALLERIAFIRPTHYGGFWDFTSDLSSKDTAYTSLALGAHTDTTYFTDPAGLQMFHLLSHTGGEGGASLLVDGFKAAEQLRRESPEAYEILSTEPIDTHASGNDDVHIRPARPCPVLSMDSENQPYLVRWNNDDRRSLSVRKDHDAWYGAARKWVEILRSSQNEYWEQLRPGRPLSTTPNFEVDRET
ncbi:hypothetical protein MMC19_007703 [Ptychographa xylographoides]|nr:hypothetical protein [Ptychographa xylographoides]